MEALALAAVAALQALALFILSDIKRDLRELRRQVQEHESFIAAWKLSHGGTMKTILSLVILLAATRAQARPYFRPLDPSHPQPVAGALLDPSRLGDTSAASLLPLVTHSPADGCLLPTVVCEDWTPLAVGAAMNAGKLTFDVAPLANVLPWMQSAALAIIPAKYDAARRFFAPGPSGPVTFSAGPVWEYSQRDDRGRFKVFTGLALHF